MTQSLDPLPGLGITAVLVADARANETVKPEHLFDDPFAATFVERACAVSPAIAEAVAAARTDEAIMRARYDSVAVRTRYCDDYLRTAMARGCRQVVLVAAGLDARAFRLDWPNDLRLWELDSPEMFEFKERVLNELGAAPRCQRTVVPLDLRTDWPSALLAADFDRSMATAWLIEGLLMYLDESGRNLLLGRIDTLTGADGCIALDHRPGFFATPIITTADGKPDTSATEHFAKLAVEASSAMSLTSPTEWLRRHGWRAHVEDAPTAFIRYNRPVPAQLRNPGNGGARAWLAIRDRYDSVVGKRREGARA
jgi:methyltransferase (TIGR00027 family)